MKHKQGVENWYKLMDFTKTEVKIFESLFDLRSVAEISLTTKIPRMSVHVIIKRFIARGMVDIHLVGKRKKYIIKNKFPQNQKEIIFGDNEKMLVHRGKEELFKIWDELSKIKQGRFIIYQSNNSVIHSLKKTDSIKLFALNEHIKNTGQISEAFLERGYLESAGKNIQENLSTSWKKSLKRSSVVHEVSHEDFYSPYELLLIRDRLYITDWENELSIEIRKREVVSIIKQFFNLLRLRSEHIDFNSKL